LDLPPTPPNIPNHIALIVPRSRVAAYATEWRSSARRTRCTAQLRSRFRRDVRGMARGEKPFSVIFESEVGAGGWSCVCRVGLTFLWECVGGLNFVDLFAVVLRQRGPEHCKQYRIRVHKKIARSIFDRLTGKLCGGGDTIHASWPVTHGVVRPLNYPQVITQIQLSATQFASGDRVRATQ
jgi:hypothetical protein